MANWTVIVLVTCTVSIIWKLTRPPRSVVQAIPLPNPSIQSQTRRTDILNPRPTTAPPVTRDEEFYAQYQPHISRDLLDAIKKVNNSRDFDKNTLVASQYHRNLTRGESEEIALMATTRLNDMLGVPRLSVTHVDPGVKVRPSQYIMVPFVVYDVKANYAVKLVATLGEVGTEMGKVKHEIVQILPFHQSMVDDDEHTVATTPYQCLN